MSDTPAAPDSPVDEKKWTGWPDPHGCKTCGVGPQEPHTEDCPEPAMDGMSGTPKKPCELCRGLGYYATPPHLAGSPGETTRCPNGCQTSSERINAMSSRVRKAVNLTRITPRDFYRGCALIGVIARGSDEDEPLTDIAARFGDKLFAKRDEAPAEDPKQKVPEPTQDDDWDEVPF